jgi:hypothetical protein
MDFAKFRDFLICFKVILYNVKNSLDKWTIHNIFSDGS